MGWETFAGGGVFLGAVLLIPGYLLLRAAGREPLAALAWGPAIPASVLGFSLFAAHVLRGEPRLFVGAAVLVLLLFAGLAFFISRLRARKTTPGPSAWGRGSEARTLLLLFLVLSASLLARHAATPVYTGGFNYRDWVLNFYEAGYWFDYSVPSADLTPPVKTPPGWFLLRPPLFNWDNAAAMALLGNGFPVFQLSAGLLNSLYALPAYLLFRRLFGSRAALAGTLLAATAPQMLLHQWFTWGKGLTLYFILLSIDSYLVHLRNPGRKPAAAFGLASGLGALSHPSSYFVTAGLGLHLLLRVVRKRASIAHVVVSAATALAIYLPLALWIAATLGPRYIFTNPGVNPKAGGPLLPLIALGYHGALNFFPLELAYYSVQFARAPLDLGIQDKLYDSTLSYYFSTLVGAVTTGLAIYGLWRLFRAVGTSPRKLWVWGRGWLARIPSESPAGPLVLVALVSFFGASAADTFFFNHGIVWSSLYPLAALLLAWGVALLLAEPERLRRRLALLIAAETLVVGLVMMLHLLFVRNLAAEPNFQVKQNYSIQMAWDLYGPNLLAVVVAAAGFAVLCLWLYRSLARPATVEGAQPPP